MRYIFIFGFLLAQLILGAQSGNYVREPKHSDGVKTKWTVTLNPDGTFLYHFLRDLSSISKINTEENFYGKGTWELQGKIILFSNNPDDMNEKYTVNLNNSKARYITKSPRDKSDKVVNTALRFYDSETSHIIGLELFKK